MSEVNEASQAGVRDARRSRANAVGGRSRVGSPVGPRPRVPVPRRFSSRQGPGLPAFGARPGTAASVPSRGRPRSRCGSSPFPFRPAIPQPKPPCHVASRDRPADGRDRPAMRGRSGPGRRPADGWDRPAMRGRSGPGRRPADGRDRVAVAVARRLGEKGEHATVSVCIGSAAVARWGSVQLPACSGVASATTGRAAASAVSSALTARSRVVNSGRVNWTSGPIARA